MSSTEVESAERSELPPTKTVEATGEVVYLIDDPNDGRAYVPKRGNASYDHGFRQGQGVRYRARRNGPVMNVTITALGQDNSGRIFYQVKDSAGVPVRLAGSKEAEWIPEDKLYA